MSGKVILHVKNGIGPGKEIVIQNRTMCTVGRGNDCFLIIPRLEVSRRHCVLDIDPPHIRVRDLGSRNGTFLNGDRIGRRDEGQSPEEAQALEMPALDLKEGDEVGLGSVVISISIAHSTEVSMAEHKPEAVEV